MMTNSYLEIFIQGVRVMRRGPSVIVTTKESGKEDAINLDVVIFPQQRILNHHDGG